MLPKPPRRWASAMPRRVGGRGGLRCTEAWVVRPGGTASSADLGGSSKYSRENRED